VEYGDDLIQVLYLRPAGVLHAWRFLHSMLLVLSSFAWAEEIQVYPCVWHACTSRARSALERCLRKDVTRAWPGLVFSCFHMTGKIIVSCLARRFLGWWKSSWRAHLISSWSATMVCVVR